MVAAWTQKGARIRRKPQSARTRTGLHPTEVQTRHKRGHTRTLEDNSQYQAWSIIFGINMDFPTAKEVKNLYRNDKYDEHLSRIKEKIESAGKDGENTIHHHLDDDQYLYDKLHDFLVEKGYSVSWNRACLWMDISWE